MPNIAFTRILKINNRVWEFNFRKLPGDHLNYHVDFTDAKNERVMFSMYKDAHGRWHVTGSNLPMWILNEEVVLGSAIEEVVAA
jgi:hypothetical protein